MDILEFAKKLEREGEAYYSHLAKTTPIKALAGIFTLLSHEEHYHYTIFESWKKEIPNAPPIESGILGKAKEVFAQLAKSETPLAEVSGGPQAYAKALELEQKSIAYYSDAQTKTDMPEHRTLFKFLIKEEKKHAVLMENLIEFVKRPSEWLENAEFSRLDE
jgi:rubrerythrin